MMSRLAIIVIGITLPGFVCSLQADPSDIVEGYKDIEAGGETDVGAPSDIVKGYKDQLWGASAETVQEAFPDGSLKTGGKEIAWLTVKGQPPTVHTVYSFMMDQLYFVRVTLKLPMRPEDGEDPDGKKMIEEMIKEKYYPDEEARKLLTDAKVSVHVGQGPNGTVIVMYENFKIFREAQAEQQLAEQERDEKRRAEEGPKRQRALQDAGRSRLSMRPSCHRGRGRK